METKKLYTRGKEKQVLGILFIALFILSLI